MKLSSLGFILGFIVGQFSVSTMKQNIPEGGKMEIVTWFSNRIQSERKRLKLKVRETAKFCEVTAKEWGEYEAGIEAPAAKVLFKFAQLGADMNFLFTGSYLTEEEENLLDHYRNTDFNGRSIIFYVAENTKKFPPQKPWIKSVIKFDED